MKVEFLKSAVTRANLGYVPGEIGELDDKLAEQLIKEGYVRAADGGKKAEPAKTTRKATKIKKVS